MNRNLSLWLMLGLFGSRIALAQTPLLSSSTAQPVGVKTSKVLVSDLTRIRQVGGIQLAPDGSSRTLYTLTTIEPQPDAPDEFDYRTHIYLSGLKPNSAVALTRGVESARQAVWQPIGPANGNAASQQIAFVRNVKGKPQLFIMPLGGGEAYALTNVPYGASNPVFSPDGKRLLFTSSVTFAEMQIDTVLNPGKRGPLWSIEKPGLSLSVITGNTAKPNPDGSLVEIRAYLAKDETDKKAKVITRMNFQGEATTEPMLSFQHVYVIDVREGATPRPITRGFASYLAPVWMPDGQTILAVTDRDPAQHPDRDYDSAIVAIKTDGSGTATSVLSEAGKSFGNPTPSLTGSWLAYLVGASRDVGFAQLGLATLNGTTATNPKLVAFDRAAGNLAWATTAAAPATKRPRGQKTAAPAESLYFIAPTNGDVPLYRLNVATGVIDKVTKADRGITAFAADGDRLVYATTSVNDPSALEISALTGQNEAVLEQPNAGWLARKSLSYPEKHIYTNSKGQVIDYWIMKPAGLQAGKTYPLVLNMHGGPTAMWGPGEASMWHELQYLCAQGYGVVYANPRGSGGYGQAFQRANVRDWGTGPAEDVLAAATAAAREPWVDTTRQVITGGSYAGYLTAWIVAHDNRFKAAFAQRGVYDLTTFMGEGNAWNLVPNYFGYPWEAGAKAILDANSPYSFVQNIKTPLLIKHGENDLRTGIIQSEMMYKSLKILNRPVEYVRMPGATHELSRSGNVRQRIDRMLRIYEFFERFVGQPAPDERVK